MFSLLISLSSIGQSLEPQAHFCKQSQIKVDREFCSGWKFQYDYVYHGPTWQLHTDNISGTMDYDLQNSSGGHPFLKNGKAEITNGMGTAKLTENRPADEENGCDEVIKISVVAPQGTNVKNGEIVKLLIETGHNHFLWGEWHPLLGKRSFTLNVDGINVQIDTEIWKERFRQSINFPDRTVKLSLAQSSDSYSIGDIRIPAKKKFILKFTYQIAIGSQSDLSVKITQYRDGPHGFKTLYDSTKEVVLKNDHHYPEVKEFLFTTEEDANELSVRFGFSSKESLEGKASDIYIKDITLREMMNIYNPQGQP